MGKLFERLDESHRAFIEAQHLFFVATAPLSPDGHVNLSPKGLDAFRVLDDRTVAYLDLTGSGAETLAHLRENGRITLLFCAFEGPPKILRLYGRGRAVLPEHPEWEELSTRFDTMPGIRSILRVDLTRIADSCGFGVPRFEFRGDRDQLLRYAEAKGPDGLVAYQAEKNAVSIDGLPALDASR